MRDQHGVPKELPEFWVFTFSDQPLPPPQILHNTPSTRCSTEPEGMLKLLLTLAFFARLGAGNSSAIRLLAAGNGADLCASAGWVGSAAPATFLAPAAWGADTELCVSNGSGVEHEPSLLHT